MSTRSGRVRTSAIETSPIRTRKGVSPPRSPARTRKTSPASKSSPARKSSPPARSSRKSPSRKSPSRKPASKFPARKSPSRTTKETAETASQKSPTKRPAIKTDTNVSVKLEDLSSKLEIFRSTRSKRTEYSIKDVISSTSNDLPELEKVNGVDSNDLFGLRNRKSVEEVPPRRSSRLKEVMDNVPDIRRSLSKSISKSVSKSISQSLDTYSDEEISEEELFKDKIKPVTRKLATPLRGSESKLVQMGSRWEFGGRVGSALLIILIPLVVFAILISCKKSCSLKTILNINKHKSIGQWLTVHAGIFSLCQYLVQAIFAIVPLFGTKADRLDETGNKYCFNAFFASVFTVNALYLLDFFEMYDKEALLNEYLQLAVVSYIFAVLLSLLLYVKSRNIDSTELNLYGSTGYKLYDFFMGREIHPFIKKLDVKVWISRVSNINSLILTALIFKQGLQYEYTKVEDQNLSIDSLKVMLQNMQTKPTILVFSLMQLTYILNFVMKEHKVTTTFFWQSEGVGYLQVVSSALYPFYFTSISKFVADTQLSLSTNILISASVLYVLGFFIMLISNNIKHEFRTNPLQPSMANLDSMPTFHGKKLLVSRLWGLLRHPNYAGDILIHLALATPGVVSENYVAAAPALLTILVLLHRAWRDHARCGRRYGAAWNRYCKRVPSLIIPKVL
ncbi:delta(14)-sterol reductase [Ostrinia furnacalis]|uniref:delta(14)-sterol reductase n=1 Tax=Ostrinia furnacalis TaxID=93504 RepID=UPI00103AEC92|nr:delta(14)-sterol reductase [Ostrinia furnacalis]